MNPVPGIPRLLVLSLLGAGLAACGSADPVAPAGEEPDEATREAAEEELAKVTAPLGEPTCGSTAADATTNMATGGFAQSPNGSYDHPTCRNAFVVDITGMTAGQTIYAGPASKQSWPDPFTCLLHWGHASVWKKQASGAYTKVIENTRLGTWQAAWRTGFSCTARVGLPVTEDGDYKVVVSGGFLFGAYEAVDVTAY